ncbi:MAG: hypothetical protein RBT63_01340 [Bdellovibrionales bacterium]|jgi:hypothetical protein|nr:hypothetical protein [Bdellovibrionales bacterium]
MNESEFKGPMLVRLFGRSNTQVLSWLSAQAKVASEVAVLGYGDGIIIEEGAGPRVVGVFPEAFVAAFAHHKLTYDLSGAGIIIGVNEETRVIAASLSRLGLKRLFVVDADDRKTEQMVQILRRRLFGIDIQTVARVALTQVPTEASVAVCLADPKEEALIEDISYLNFLKERGLWIDWSGAGEETRLQDEVMSAGSETFSANVIRAWRDAWLVATMTGQKPNELAERLAERYKGLTSS